jgi:hypothetical protein
MVSSQRHRGWIGHRLVDVAGVRIGEVEEVLIDPDTSLKWLAVRMGRFGRQVTLVPVRDVVAGDHRMWIPLARSAVRSAPRIPHEGWTCPTFRERLYRHYGLAGAPRRPRAAAAIA